MANGLTIIKDRTSVGNIPNVELDPQGLGLLATLHAGNSVDVQRKMNALNAVLEPMEMQLERKDGTALPVEVSNMFFMKGSVTTDAPEFKSYKDKFDLNRSVGYNVVAYNYDSDTILASERGVLDIDAEKLKATRKITNTYAKRYLPFSRLKALITGTTESSNIPTDDGGATSGVNAFTRAFGCARGEDFSDFLTITSGDGIRNFYRTTETATLATDDVDSLVDAIRAVDDYSMQGVVALAHPRTLKNYAKLSANDTMTKDEFVFNTVNKDGTERKDGMRAVDIDGVKWVAVDGFHEDFAIFYDMGKLEELLIRGVEEGDPNQRGLGLIYEGKLDSWSTIRDLDGAKLRIFPEEWYMPWRLSVGILDMSGDNHHATGYMQAGSVAVLEAWATTMDGYFKTSE